MIITFPWPPKDLSPNARIHWARRHKSVKAYRGACNLIATTAKAGKAVTWDGPIHLWIEFVPPDRRHRDDDNLIASFKAGRDGLADAMGVDDSRFTIHPVISATEIGGMVRVKITEDLTGW